MSAVLNDLVTKQDEPERKRERKPMNAPVVNLQWVLIPVFCAMTGYSDKAVRRKIQEGKWIEGRHYRKAPDGHITMNLPAYYEWVEGKQLAA